MALPATESFTNSDGTSLTSHSASWTNAAGSFTIQGNALHCAVNVDSIAFWNADSFNADQYAECTASGLTGAAYTGLAVRASANNGYLAYWDSADCYIGKIVGGSWTQLGATITAPTASTVVRLTAEGVNPTTLTVYYGGASQTTRTDSDLDSGAAGVSGYGTNQFVAAAIDDWEGGNLGAGPAPSAPKRSLLLGIG